MALLESLIIPLGTSMPSFKLKNPQGQEFKSTDFLEHEKCRGLLVVFTCNHCPYSKAVWPRLISIAQYAKGLHINTVAINPNIHPDFPEDAPDKMIEKVKELGITFPYLVDDTQQTAKAFKAQCTPDIYLFDKNQKLIYHGRIDDNWQNESKVTRQELKDAITHHADGLEIDSNQKPSMGCSIKWK